jgi:hypothetical protein
VGAFFSWHAMATKESRVNTIFLIFFFFR